VPSWPIRFLANRVGGLSEGPSALRRSRGGPWPGAAPAPDPPPEGQPAVEAVELPRGGEGEGDPHGGVMGHLDRRRVCRAAGMPGTP
jgi:hypothetical protein